MIQSNYHLEFYAAAIMIYAVTLFYYYTKKNVKNVQHIIFGCLIWISLAAAIVGGAGFYLVTIRAAAPLVNVALVIYHLSIQTGNFLLMVYIISNLEIREKMSAFENTVILIPAIAINVIAVATPFTGWLFSYSVDQGYSRGTLHFLCYLIPIVYYVEAVIYLYRNRSVYNKTVRNYFIFFSILCIVPSYVQFANPTYLTECFISAIAVQLMMFTMNTHDELIDSQTGMLNRKSLAEYVSKLIYHKLPFASIFVRIADYELMSSVYGIQKTEELMWQISQKLSTYVERGMGFCVSNSCFVLLTKDRTHAHEMEETIENVLSEAWEIDGIEIAFSSFVTTVFYPEKAKDIDSYFAYLTYFQKMKKQRYGIIPADELTIKDKLREQKVERAIRRGLEEHNFTVYYQPICTTMEQHFVTAEALVRLTDPELGAISPAEFIPIAEKNGMIIEIGSYVLESVCTFIENNDMEQLGLEYIEVNLSVIQCLQRDFISYVLYTMKKHHIAAKYICFEITETAANCSPKTFTQHLERLHQSGFELALDDFGTGYGNLQRLMTSPFSVVKMDKDTTEKSCSDEKLKVAMQAMFDILHRLGKVVVAEGVETKEQYEILCKAGCDYIQGYYFSKPIPEEELKGFLLSRRK